LILFSPTALNYICIDPRRNGVGRPMAPGSFLMNRRDAMALLLAATGTLLALRVLRAQAGFIETRRNQNGQFARAFTDQMS
jgi:hypothetical protein